MNWYKFAKKEDNFDYSSEIRDLWLSLVRKEMDRVNIHFDLENDEPIASKELDLFTDNNGREYKIVTEARSAGGDWECPNIYFRCQIKTRYSKDGDFSSDRKAVYICPKSPNLTDSEGKKVAKNNNESECQNINSKDHWDHLKKDITKRIRENDDSLVYHLST